MDFFTIRERINKEGVVEVFPDFKVCRSKDLMVRAKSFYAIWDEQRGMWSTDEYDVQRLVDQELWNHAKELQSRGSVTNIQSMGSFSSRSWVQFRSYLGHLTDNSHQLDDTLTFSNSIVTKEDHVSKRLAYPLSEEGAIDSYEQLVNVLYEPEQRQKFEWAIGSVIAGDSRFIQKFLVFYGAPGTGKGTVIGIAEQLFDGYVSAFSAKDLTSGSNQFATEPFRGNPLVAIDHDGDLSRIADNTRLNSIVSHETLLINEKNKPTYATRINAFLFIGSNKAVKITDAKSGIIRRLIDVHPTGEKIAPRKYQVLHSRIQFELGAIAAHCLNVYRELGRDHYASYKPVEMMLETDVFLNFIEDSYDIFKEQDGCTLVQAYALYKEYCQESMIEFKLPLHKFREELKSYFRNFDERIRIDDVQMRSYYSGFITDSFTVQVEPEAPMALILEETQSVVDIILAEYPAQYSTEDGTPRKFWDDSPRRNNRGEEFIPNLSQVCNTRLKEIDTSHEHYVKPPENHIVIDFDLKDDQGNKSAELNLEAASKWPSTYAEFSKGGSGIHLHYIYDGDPSELSRIFAQDIEVKVFSGNSSLRRRLSFCNNIPVATISGGLPLKEKKMINESTLKSEKALRELIDRNLRKEIHIGTKPSMDFIRKILDDAYESGLEYDLSDYKPKILVFANNSTNQASYCLGLLPHLKWEGQKKEEDLDSYREMETPESKDDYKDTAPIAYFDVEVFPNLFVVCWKYACSDQVVRMINPSPAEVEELLKLRLVGFNNRQYDNHIIYGRIMGYSNEQLYALSQKIISNAPGSKFGEAYNLSYADIYDYASKKQGLKKWQVELGIHHVENHHPWDQPVPDELIEEIVEYCCNDVMSTEDVAEATEQDLNARKILAELSGMPINTPTNTHSARIIFDGNRAPQDEFVYTQLATGVRSDGKKDKVAFPGYEFHLGKSTYKEVEVGEGGLVDSNPGFYTNVGVLDITSMHPTSAIQMDLFGPYTKNFLALLDARVAIKRKEYDRARKMFNGALAPYLGTDEQAKQLSYALKIVINSVYGLTAAKYPNPFKDPRNKDNIVAKRGALFMVDLKEYVEGLGYTVVHIKTDSIKIPDIDQFIIDKVAEFGAEYGYEFEFESLYSKFCLVNDAVYIAQYASEDVCIERFGYIPDNNRSSAEKWDAVGAQFQHPYVYKSLFSKEVVQFEDLSETKAVTSQIYLWFSDEDYDTPMALSKQIKELTIDDCRFIGRVGSFVPVLESGGTLLREKDGKFFSVTGTKGYLWQERDVYETANGGMPGHADLVDFSNIDFGYFNHLVEDAIEKVQQYVDIDEFIGKE